MLSIMAFTISPFVILLFALDVLLAQSGHESSETVFTVIGKVGMVGMGTFTAGKVGADGMGTFVEGNVGVCGTGHPIHGDGCG